MRPDDLQRQIRSSNLAGVGGFFMHARPGLRTPFLRDGWWDAVAAAVEQARACGLKAWIYDESSYPSGFAGGLVPSAHPELRQKTLVCRPWRPNRAQQPIDGAVLGHYWVDEVLGRCGMVDETSSPTELEASHLVEVAWQFAPPENWLNGGSYVDLLDPRTAAAFVETAYEPYRERWSDDFAETIPGIFTDEPNLRHNSNGYPWTANFPQLYQARHQQSIIPELPNLFFRLPGAEAVRFRYWRLISEQFVTAWCRPIYQWCDRQKLAWTGHYWEHAMDPRFTGSMMAPLRYQHIPGVDLLGPDRNKGKDVRVNDQVGNIRMIKAASSVAHQFGQPRVLSETYGGAGWDISFEDQKRIAEWEFVLGVNLLNVCMTHYSLLGARKHDYPPSFLHQPWWQDYRHLGLYLQRIQYALSQGQPYADVAVLHPMTSLWTMPWDGQKPSPATDSITLGLDHLLKDLSEAAVTWDLVDELHLEEVGAVEGKSLRVGLARYQAVVIPPSINLTAPTVDILRRYQQAGGLIVALAPCPTLVDGRPEHPIGKIFSDGPVRVFLGVDDLLSMLHSLGLTRLHWPGQGRTPVYVEVRDGEPGEVLLYLVHTGEETLDNVEIIIRDEFKRVQEWDPSTGKMFPVTVRRLQDGTAISLGRIDPGQSRLLLAPGVSSAQASAEVACESRPVLDMHRLFQPHWDVSFDRANVLLLDRACWKTGEGIWSRPAWIRTIGCRLRQMMGLPTDDNAFSGIQPWVKYRQPAPMAGPMLCLRLVVGLAEPNADFLHDARLIVEQPMWGHIAINGHRVDSLWDGESFWVDPSWRSVVVGPWLHPGDNVITLCFRYRENIDIEPVYLAGDFSVDSADLAEFRLKLPKSTLCGGPWANQGYPFFAGRVTARTSIYIPPDARGSSSLTLHPLLAPVAIVRVNGTDCGAVGWRPYTVNITAAVKPGENSVELEVASSLRNLLGPHHAQESYPLMVGPQHFVSHPETLSSYNLVAEGLPRQIEVGWQAGRPT